MCIPVSAVPPASSGNWLDHYRLGRPIHRGLYGRKDELGIGFTTTAWAAQSTEGCTDARMSWE